jgi:hypothetical protein
MQLPVWDAHGRLPALGLASHGWDAATMKRTSCRLRLRCLRLALQCLVWRSDCRRDRRWRLQCWRCWSRSRTKRGVNQASASRGNEGLAMRIHEVTMQLPLGTQLPLWETDGRLPAMGLMQLLWHLLRRSGWRSGWCRDRRWRCWSRSRNMRCWSRRGEDLGGEVAALRSGHRLMQLGGEGLLPI